jgi:hypothetical protein
MCANPYLGNRWWRVSGVTRSHSWHWFNPGCRVATANKPFGQVPNPTVMFHSHNVIDLQGIHSEGGHLDTGLDVLKERLLNPKALTWHWVRAMNLPHSPELVSGVEAVQVSRDCVCLVKSDGTFAGH